MEAWGTAIFSDDLASDVRSDWRDHLGNGLTPEEATRRILSEYKSSARDLDEGPVFWIALAVAQWKTGRLQDEVRDAALTAIDRGEDLKRWINPVDRRKREAVLKKTREQLVSPQPAAKRVCKRALSETPFKDGDVIVYRHASGSLFEFGSAALRRTKALPTPAWSSSTSSVLRLPDSRP